MKKIVLLRHGESIWNRENRFTGWTDVDLTDTGKAEAGNAGDLLVHNGFIFNRAYTSFLKRAIKTLNIVLDKMNQDWLPVYKTWRLNEKHYGALQGLNKAETARTYGEEQVKIWRRSYRIAPPALEYEDPRDPRFDIRYRIIPATEIPLTESLMDTVIRVVPYWRDEIMAHLAPGEQILVAAHGNSIRAIVKYILHLTDEEIVDVNIPTGIPYVFEFEDDDTFLRDYYLGDPEEVARRAAKVANQGKAG